jgi:hypothetical protein
LALSSRFRLANLKIIILKYRTKKKEYQQGRTMGKVLLQNCLKSGFADRIFYRPPRPFRGKKQGAQKRVAKIRKLLYNAQTLPKWWNLVDTPS